MNLSDALTGGTLSVPGLVLAGLLAAAYAVAVRRAENWPRWRIIAFYLLGIGSLVYATCGPLGAHQHTRLWVFAARVAVLVAVTPLGLALGDPVRLIAAGRGREFDLPIALRWLFIPLIGSALSAVTVLLVFTTDYGLAASRSSWVDTVLVLHLLVVGSAAVLPLLVDELLPAWATAPVRAFFAFLDGLIDAIPGIVVMTAGSLLMPRFGGFHGRPLSEQRLDQTWAGGALLAIVEAIGLPVIIAVFLEWLRSDRDEAAAVDLELDQLAEADDGASDEPWWLHDPRFAGRFNQRRGADEDS